MSSSSTSSSGGVAAGTLLRADFSVSVNVPPSAQTFVPSPTMGVDRVLLDRIGGERARATSYVRYARDSSFPAHTHTGGEEFFVLEGIFSDEHGHFPAGTYVRNPIGSKHAPFTKDGCTIYVKLYQFNQKDDTHVVVDTNQRDKYQPVIETHTNTTIKGVSQLPLHQYGDEHICMYRFDSGATLDLSSVAVGGIEYIVVHGEVEEVYESPQEKQSSSVHLTRSWVRHPSHQAQPQAQAQLSSLKFTLSAGKEGATILIKTGHLIQTPTAPEGAH